MRAFVLMMDVNRPDEFEEDINGQIETIESEQNGYVVDVKLSVDTSDPACLCALILWEKKDAEDQTRAGLREERYRGRYKTW